MDHDCNNDTTIRKMKQDIDSILVDIPLLKQEQCHIRKDVNELKQEQKDSINEVKEEMKSLKVTLVALFISGTGLILGILAYIVNLILQISKVI